MHIIISETRTYKMKWKGLSLRSHWLKLKTIILIILPVYCIQNTVNSIPVKYLRIVNTHFMSGSLRNAFSLTVSHSINPAASMSKIFRFKIFLVEFLKFLLNL